MHFFITSQRSTDFIKKYGIIFILVFFVAISITGIFFNYPVSTTIGDETVLMAATLKMIAEPSFRPNYPTNYHMPFGAYIYLPFFVVFLVFLRLSGLFTGTEDIIAFGMLDYAKLLPVARFISVFLGAVSVYLVYKICERLFKSKFISLVAAFFLSTDLMFVYLSHFGKVWLPQIFVILIALYFIVVLYQKENVIWKDYLLAAFFTGVSFGTHFIGILIYFPFLVVHYLKNKSKKLNEIFIFNKYFWFSNLVIAGLMFLVYYLNPYGFINYGSYSAVIATDVVGDSIGVGGGGVDFLEGFTFYGIILWEYAPILTLIYLFAMIPLFLQRRDLFLILNSFVLGYYSVIGPLMGSVGHPHPHYVSPIVPFMAIVAAYGIHYAYKKSAFVSISPKIRIALMTPLFVSFLYLPLLWDYTLIKPTTIIAARDWIYNNIPQEAGILNFYGYLQLNETRESIEDTSKYNPNFLIKRQKYLLSISDIDYPKPNYYVLVPTLYFDGVPKELLEKEFDYAILSWMNRNDYESVLRQAELFGVKEKNLLKIFPTGATFDSSNSDIENIRHPLKNLPKLDYVGPIIAIYKLK